MDGGTYGGGKGYWIAPSVSVGASSIVGFKDTTSLRLVDRVTVYCYSKDRLCQRYLEHSP